MFSRRPGAKASRIDPLQLDLFSFQQPLRTPLDYRDGKDTASFGADRNASPSLKRESQSQAVPKAKTAAESNPQTEIVPEPLRVPPAHFEADTPQPQPQRNRQNYRISDDDKLGSGSLKSKCRGNLAVLELLRRLDREKRSPSDEEKRCFVRYVGWGGLPQIFDSRNDEWREERGRLEGLLSPEELESARATTLNAHYTSAIVIAAMYSALRRFGFEYGRILEPACGIGHFIGLMPNDMHGRSQITAVEIDSVTAGIAKALYPDADVRHQPFEEARLADSFYDVAISNIPFGNYKPFDPRFKSWNFLIHDYFFASALEKVRPGGLILFVTSRGTLDKVDRALREYVSSKADLLGAIRLPNDAFKRNANTEVTTDIVMLRKRLPGELPSGPPWQGTAQVTNSLGEVITVNEYFAARPEMMLGEMRLEGRMYQRGEPTLVGNGRDLAQELPEVVAFLPQDVFQRRRVTTPSRSENRVPAPEDVKPNAYALLNGELAIREGDTMRVLTGLPSKTSQRIRGLIRIRDAVRLCLRSQLNAQTEANVVSAREELNRTYDLFVGTFGPISEPANASSFRGDPDLALLLSLENYDPETRLAAKAAIFRERTVSRDPPTPKIESAQDALHVTLNTRGRVDLDFLSNLLHRPVSEVTAELKGAIFLDPQTNTWETEDAYLSGNVRERLPAAEAAALVDERFNINVDALKDVQPTDLSPSEIDARLGSSWIPPEDVRCFAEELLNETGVSVSHVNELGLWQVHGAWSVRTSVSNTTEWGTDRRCALDLLEDALNLRTPTIYDHDAVADRDVVNVSATEAARDKQEKIKERFKSWVWQDDERRERLAQKYNHEFNNVRLRTFRGDHLTLPGASAAVSLNPHQKAAVWRILQTPNCLLAHVVGAGKTFTVVAAAMELKRLGLARKSLFAVPNHMLEQFSSELLTLYPGANILVATKEDFEKTKRQTLMSRIATGNWDAVIVTHSGFEKIPVSKSTQEEFFKEQIRELTLATEKLRQQEDSRMVKTLERAKKRLETQLKELMGLNRKDEGLTFEELGVDHLFIDEAHAYKNLFYVSKMTRIAGLPQTASQRALDMFLKVSHVQRCSGGGGVVFATGTPIANSVAEMFTMQRYLQMTALKALGVDHFDSWAATFGEPVTAMELSPDGSGYRLHTRFARFINVPELMQQFRQVADIQTQPMLKLPIPEIQGGRPTVVSAPCSPELKNIVESLAKRAERLRSGAVNPREDNMLLVTTDGRKAALDLRLHTPDMHDHPDSKVNRALDVIERIWRETAHNRSTQLIFCDLSTPTGRKGFSVYEDMRAKLSSRGIPEKEIAFIQDFDSDAAKAALFRDVRAGRVRILFGTTQKMGSGTNVQKRLIALHHLDAPWRPADVEQREGRILRQGNSNCEVQIYRYVTEASFDAYMWQTLETKAKFISQVMTGESDLRRIEDVDGTALTYAEVKAIASGNPLVIEKASIDAEVARLARLQTQHHESDYRIRRRIRYLNDELPRLEKRLQCVRTDIGARRDTRGDSFAIEIDGQTIDDRAIAGEMLNRHAARLDGTSAERRVGSFAGFALNVAGSIVGNPKVLLKGSGTYDANVGETAQGTIRSIEYALQKLEELAGSLENEIKDTRKRLADLTAQSGQPFEYADRLHKLIRRQQEVTDALDLSKNQASSRLESKPTPLPESDAMTLGEIDEYRDGHHEDLVPEIPTSWFGTVED